MPEWDEHTRLQNEKEVLGFFVSGHPHGQVPREAAQHEGRRHRHRLRDEARAAGLPPRPAKEPQNEIQIAGVITGLESREIQTLRRVYAQAILEDTTGKIELIAFPQSYEKLAEKLKIDVPVLVRGVLRGEEDSAPKLAISQYPGARRREDQAA